MKYGQLRTIILAAVAMLACGTMRAEETPSRAYTQEHPLVYEDSWDLWPYVFLNETGEPDGYNVELLHLLCKELGIPYVIKLLPSKDALADLQNGTADLTFGMCADFHDDYGQYGTSILQLFTHSVLTPNGLPVAIRTMDDLGTHRVIVHDNSFSHHLMQERGWGQNAVPFADMKEAVQKASTESNEQIVWNTMSLKWLVRKYQIENMKLTPIDMPHGEYRFMSNDPVLLHQLDSVYADLRARELLVPIQNKWFYPENEDTGIPSWVWTVAAILTLTAIGLTVYNIIYRMREREMTRLVRHNNNRLAQILNAGQVLIWTYDVERQTFAWLDKSGKPSREYTAMEFARRYRREEYEKIYNALMSIARQETERVTLEVMSHDDGQPGDDERQYTVILSVLRRDKGKPTVIIGTKRDVTEEREKQRKAKELRMRYQSVFNTAMVDQVYYDENGILTNLNQKACDTFHCQREELLARRVSINDVTGLKDLRLDQPEIFYATQILNIPASEGSDQSGAAAPSKAYYELQLVPVFNKQGQRLCIYGTGRDITEFVNNYHKEQESINKTKAATRELTDYIENINLALKEGGVRIVNYLPDSHTMTIYQDINNVWYTLTQTRCVSLVDDQSKKEAMRLLNSLDNRTSKPRSASVKTAIRLKGGGQLYLQFHFVPVLDDQQRVVSYFGMCRDISEMKATEQQLRQETAKAQETEVVKNAFLTNMSYEIRTPLNAVVGFAEQFEMEHTREDEEVFIDEIKKNSAFLLKLINDILFLSRLDARMIDIKPQPIDFAKVFESHCQMGWLNQQREGVKYVVDNPYQQLVVDIDDSNVGKIIEQITSNATAHTERGTVRARYDYVNGQLIVAVADTGCGIAKADLGRIFERFVSGGGNSTGLGLSICRELARQMGGSIEIRSELNKGTTVWITIPCTATVIERKEELAV